MAVNRYVDTSATYNGDGTTAAQAASDGGVGAYNTIAGPLADAPNAPSPGSEWDIWVRRLSSDISITAQLSPTNNGSYNAPHRLIGWPFRVQHTGYTVDSVPSGTDNLGFDKAKWQFVDSDLTEDDNYWIGAEVEFTSGNNNGLKRMVIWFDATNDTVYLDFPLPNDIATSDQYTITLETEEYSNRPQSGIDEGWDSDSKVRPALDGGGGSFSLMKFEYDFWWYLFNFELKNIASSGSYALIYYLPKKVKNCLIHDGVGLLWLAGQNTECEVENTYLWNAMGTSWTVYALGCFLRDVHINKGPSGNASSGIYAYGNPFTRLKNVTIGRITSFTNGIRSASAVNLDPRGENVLIDATNEFSVSSDRYISTIRPISISGWQGESDKFKIAATSGEVYNVDEDATINPPSGSTTYIKMVPGSYCSSEHWLQHEEQRYQSSGSKTYTWKIYPTGWSGLSTSDIELEAWYLDESTGTHRAITTANPSSVTNDSWNDLSITVNPSQAGTVYFTLKLKRYEASAYIALDPEPSVT